MDYKEKKRREVMEHNRRRKEEIAKAMQTKENKDLLSRVKQIHKEKWNTTPDTSILPF